MAATNMSGPASTEATNSSSADYSDTLASVFEYTFIEYVTLVLTVIVFIFGIASWILIKKFRHFKNYVFLNAILATIFSLISMFADFTAVAGNSSEINFMVVLFAYDFMITYLKLVVHCWLVVLCWIFYVDIVKVFCVNVSRRYFKSSLFAWGAPLIVYLICSLGLPLLTLLLSKHFTPETTAAISNVSYFMDVLAIFIPLIINFFIYIKVLVVLFKTSNVNQPTDKCRRFYIATLIFLLSGVVFLTAPLWLLVKTPDIVITTVNYLQTVSMDVYFLIVKSNRDLWSKYFVKRFKKASCVVNSNCKEECITVA